MTIAEAPVTSHERNLAMGAMTPERLEGLMNAMPATQGVYEGVDLEADGVYFSPAILKSGDILPQITGAKVIGEAQLSAGDSQNGVLFADMAVQTGTQQTELKVAVKPFVEDPTRAGYEHDRLIDVKAMGFETFRPIAIVKEGETNCLVTEFRDGFTTLDNVNWTLEPSDPRYATELLPSLHFIADHLGEIHGKGLFNGDPQVKNFAKADDGKAIVMDLEFATIAQTPEEHAIWISGGYEIRDSKVYQDVKQFWFSLTRGIGTDNPNVFLQTADHEAYMAELENNFLEPYFQSLQKYLPSEVAHRVDLAELHAQLSQTVG